MYFVSRFQNNICNIALKSEAKVFPIFTNEANEIMEYRSNNGHEKKSRILNKNQNEIKIE